MFLGTRRLLVEDLVLAPDDESRSSALAAMLPLQREDFTRILAEMDGLPVTIRLIDPPLHEFLPDLTKLSVDVALEDERNESDPARHRLLAAVRAAHEQNPMLGLRGVRLGLTQVEVGAVVARQRVHRPHVRRTDYRRKMTEPIAPKQLSAELGVSDRAIRQWAARPGLAKRALRPLGTDA